MASVQAHESQLAVDALVVVKLRVRGPLLLHNGDLRAEPLHREGAIVDVEPERARRAAMLAMHRDGLIALPAPQGRQNRPGPIVFGPDTEPPLFPAPTTLGEVRPLDLRPVVRGTGSSSPATTISDTKGLAITVR